MSTQKRDRCSCHPKSKTNISDQLNQQFHLSFWCRLSHSQYTPLWCHKPPLMIHYMEIHKYIRIMGFQSLLLLIHYIFMKSILFASDKTRELLDYALLMLGPDHFETTLMRKNHGEYLLDAYNFD